MQLELFKQVLKKSRAPHRSIFSSLVQLQQPSQKQKARALQKELLEEIVNKTKEEDYDLNYSDASELFAEVLEEEQEAEVDERVAEEKLHTLLNAANQNIVNAEYDFDDVITDDDFVVDNPYTEPMREALFPADHHMEKLADNISNTEIERVLGAFKPTIIEDDGKEELEEEEFDEDEDEDVEKKIARLQKRDEEQQVITQAIELKDMERALAQEKAVMLNGSKGINAPNTFPSSDVFNVLETAERNELAKLIKLKRTRKLEPWEQVAFEEALKRFEIANAAHIVAKSSFEDLPTRAEQRAFVDRALFGDEQSPIKPTGHLATLAKHLKNANPSDFVEILGSGDRTQGEKRVHIGWEFIDQLMNAEDEDFYQLWNDARFKQIWQHMGGDTFKTKQGFLDSIKHAGAMKVLIDRTQILLPGYPVSTVEAIVKRVVSMLQNKASSPDQVTIVNQSIVDEVAEKDRNPFWRYVDIAAKPRPTMAAIVDSLRLITRKQVKEKQMDMVSENMVLNDPNQSENPYNTLYDNLKPIHSAAEVGALETIKAKVYEPEVINGVATAVGRRKTSSAIVRITPGNGLFMINGKSYLDYFNHDRIALVKISVPLRMIDCLQQFDVNVTVRGGGFSGQIDAIVLGLSRALAKFQPEFGSYLTKYSLMRRDPRMVERKKSGQAKARKRFQWVKR